MPAGAAIGPSQLLPSANTTGSRLETLPDEGYYLAYGNGVGGDGSRYVTRFSEAAYRWATIPQGMLTYYGYIKANPIPHNGLLRIQQAQSVRYTHHMVDVLAVPNLAILNGEGFLNDRPFDGWPRGTLFLEAVHKRYYRSAVGNRVVDLTFEMTAMPNIDRFGYPQGHNAVLSFFGGGGDIPRSARPAATRRLWISCPLNSDAKTLGRSFSVQLSGTYTDLFRPDAA